MLNYVPVAVIETLTVRLDGVACTRRCIVRKMQRAEGDRLRLGWKRDGLGCVAKEAEISTAEGWLIDQSKSRK